jgi:hypothetical protein
MSDKTHVEHNESAITLIADIPGDMDFRCNGPNNRLMHCLHQLAASLGAYKDIKRDQHALLAWSSGRRAGGVGR